MKSAAKKLGIFAGWMILWQILYLVVNRDVLIASPVGVFMNLLSLLQTGGYYMTILHTIKNIFLGFTFALIFGTISAVAAHILPALKNFIAPMMNVMKATPVASFIILALVFMKSSNLPVLVSFLMVTPLVWSNITQALGSVDGTLIEMSNLFNVSLISKLRHVYLPAAVPYFWSAFQTGLGYSWKSGITAEVLSSPRLTIGRELADAKVYLDTLSLFSWTVTAILLSIFFEKLISILALKAINRYLPKPDTKQDNNYD